RVDPAALEEPADEHDPRPRRVEPPHARGPDGRVHGRGAEVQRVETEVKLQRHARAELRHRQAEHRRAADAYSACVSASRNEAPICIAKSCQTSTNGTHAATMASAFFILAEDTPRRAAGSPVRR